MGRPARKRPHNWRARALFLSFDKAEASFYPREMMWKAAAAPSLPEGQRIYAIGDIHGRLDLLDQILRMVRLDDEAQPPALRRTLIFLGDYVDRGPESRGVIDRLISGIPAGFDGVYLKGNHEEMLLRSLTEPEMVPFWMANGGAETLASYGILLADYGDDIAGSERLTQAMAEAIPQDHLNFLRGLQVFVAFGGYFFVHAGVKPGVPLEEQQEQDCLYIREPFLTYRRSFGKMVVHGHTPVPQPEVRTNRIGIDTGGCFTGHLTALRLESESHAFLAT